MQRSEFDVLMSGQELLNVVAKLLVWYDFRDQCGYVQK